jgi:hypothetical protein
VDAARIQDAVLAELAARGPLEEAEADAATRALAGELVRVHGS